MRKKKRNDSQKPNRNNPHTHFQATDDMSNSEQIMISTDQDMFVMEDDDDDNHPHSLSRLSMCHGLEDDGDDDSNNNGGGGGGGAMTTYMSKLSIESFDGDADEEFSDENIKEKKQHFLGGHGLSSDSDKELGMADCYSLPGTPRVGQRRNSLVAAAGMFKEKEYASENEVVVQKGVLRRKTSRKYRTNRRRTTMTKERWVERGGGGGNTKNKLDDDDDDIAMRSSISCYNSMPNNTTTLPYNNGGGGGGVFSGESDQGGAGLVVITRPKGGRRSLCMDMEEVKACNDLGFELEHERMLDMPSGISLSASTLDTSSGGNSPIGSWRISSPGDNPRDVKARLKVWAQAVAIASSR